MVEVGCARPGMLAEKALPSRDTLRYMVAVAMALLAAGTLRGGPLFTT